MLFSCCSHSEYMLVIDCGSLMNSFLIGIPFLAICIDLSTGAHEAVIADLQGFKMCSPFWEVGLSVSFLTCGGIIFSAVKNCIVWMNSLFISWQCSES